MFTSCPKLRHVALREVTTLPVKNSFVSDPLVILREKGWHLPSPGIYVVAVGWCWTWRAAAPMPHLPSGLGWFTPGNPRDLPSPVRGAGLYSLLSEELLADRYQFYFFRERLNAFLETSDNILGILSAQWPVFPVEGGEEWLLQTMAISVSSCRLFTIQISSGSLINYSWSFGDEADEYTGSAWAGTLVFFTDKFLWQCHSAAVPAFSRHVSLHFFELPKWRCQDVRDWQWWSCRKERKTDGFDIAADCNCLVSYAQFNAKGQAVLARAINLFKSSVTVWLGFFHWRPLCKERWLERHNATNTAGLSN